MSEEVELPKRPEPYLVEEDEIDLYELWLTLKRYKRFIWGFTLGLTFLVALCSLFMTNLYRSKAVILPVEQQAGASSLLSQFGGLAQIAGIALPTSSGSAEIIALLKSDILKEELIKEYHLLPVILYERWDSEKKTWKRLPAWYRLVRDFKQKIFAIFQPQNSSEISTNDIPTVSDGIEALAKMLNVSEDKKLGTITVSIDYPNPEMAAKLVNYLLKTLREHMTREAIRIAEKNKQTLEQELRKTSDPTIQQKLYALIAQQVETITMARVNENFAFKVVDPPRIPEKKYKPKRGLMVAVAFVSGLFLSIFLAFFREYLRNLRERNLGQGEGDV